MDASLYVLDRELVRMIDEYADSDFEFDDEDAEAGFQQLLKAHAQKMENIIKYLRWIEMMEKAAKEEKDRLREVEGRYKKRQRKLKEYLLGVLGKDFKCETPLGKVSFRKSETVEIVEGKEVPIDYSKVKIEPDKTKIKKALKDGNDFEFAYIKTNYNFNVR